MHTAERKSGDRIKLRPPLFFTGKTALHGAKAKKTVENRSGLCI